VVDPVSITSARLLLPRPYGRIPFTTTEHIRAGVEGAWTEGKARPWMAFTRTNTVPGNAEWRPAQWAEGVFRDGAAMEILAGPRGVAKLPGTGGCWVWVRIDQAPASVHRCAGHITVT
jgi:hypothetical protein